MNCNVRLIIQISCIVIGVFGVIASIVIMAKYISGFFPIIRSIFTLIMCIALIACEIYLFPFVKYFGFILKHGGKALSYLFIGGCLFQKSGFPLFCAILYWILASIFFIFIFVLPGISLPILQGGMKEGSLPDLSISALEIYQNKNGGVYQSVLNQDVQNEV